MRRSRSPASSYSTASGRDSSDWDVWAFKAKLRLRSEMWCLGLEVSAAQRTRTPPKAALATDSPLEQDGFEPLVALADLGRSGPESRNVIFTPLTSAASAGWRAALGGRGVLDN